MDRDAVSAAGGDLMKRTDWWFSADEKRGFCLGAVTAYDYKAASESAKPTIYLYVQGGIYHLSGPEADAVYKLVKDKVKP